jgi:hypothetical protein
MQVQATNHSLCLLHVGFLFGLLLSPEDGDKMFVDIWQTAWRFIPESRTLHLGRSLQFC